MRWDYLDADAYRARYALAAWFLRDCPHLIEIGGYHLDLGDFAAPGQQVTVIGPDVEEERHAPNVRRIRGLFPRDAGKTLPADYGLVILGIDFHFVSDDWPQFEALARNAARCVFEAASDYAPGMSHLTRMQAACGQRDSIAEWQIEVIAPAYPMTEESWPSMPRRRLVCL